MTVAVPAATGLMVTVVPATEVVATLLLDDDAVNVRLSLSGSRKALDTSTVAAAPPTFRVSEASCPTACGARFLAETGVGVVGDLSSPQDAIRAPPRDQRARPQSPGCFSSPCPPPHSLKAGLPLGSATPTPFPEKALPNATNSPRVRNRPAQIAVASVPSPAQL